MALCRRSFGRWRLPHHVHAQGSNTPATLHPQPHSGVFPLSPNPRSCAPRCASIPHHAGSGFACRLATSAPAIRRSFKSTLLKNVVTWMYGEAL